jgi:hypothetical protein
MDLYESQGFENDGIFDWDILKKQQEQNKSDASGNPAEEGQGVGESNLKVAEGDTTGPSANARPTGQSGEEGNSRAEESGGDLNKDMRRSIISSIRHSLFGSRGGNRPDTGGAQTSAQSGSNRGR